MCINMQIHYTSLSYFQQFIGIGRHSTVLCADEGTDLNGGAMGLGHGLAVEDAAHERAGEGVAGADGIGYLDLRRFLEGDVTGSENVGAVGAAGEHKHVEIVLTQDEPALVLDVKTGIAKHAANEHQFLIINLQDIATLERLTQNLLRIELLA